MVSQTEMAQSEMAQSEMAQSEMAQSEMARIDSSRERLAIAPHWLGSIAAGTALGLVLVISLSLLARRLLGVPLQPLHPLAMLAVALAVTAVASVARLAWTAQRGLPLSAGKALARFAAPSFVVIILGATLWLPSTDGWSLAAYWGIVVGGEVLWWLPAIATWRPNSARRQSLAPSGLLEAGNAEPDEEPDWPAGLTQQLTRTRQEDGSELIYGVLRGEFAAGERQQTLHVAFSPPLPSLPRLTAHQVEGPDAQIKVADSQTYGVRLELRLARPPQQPESVLLEMQVACDAAASDPS